MDQKEEFRLNRRFDDFSYYNCGHGKGRPIPYWLVCRKCAIAWSKTASNEVVRLQGLLDDLTGGVTFGISADIDGTVETRNE